MRVKRNKKNGGNQHRRKVLDSLWMRCRADVWVTAEGSYEDYSSWNEGSASVPLGCLLDKKVAARLSNMTEEEREVQFLCPPQYVMFVTGFL